MNIYQRLGPPINVLDEVRSLHHRQEVGTPDDGADVICPTCYMFDREWPCAEARLLAIVDEQIIDDRLRSATEDFPAHRKEAGRAAGSKGAER